VMKNTASRTRRPSRGCACDAETGVPVPIFFPFSRPLVGDAIPGVDLLSDGRLGRPSLPRGHPNQCTRTARRAVLPHLSRPRIANRFRPRPPAASATENGAPSRRATLAA
jgi:hypothetical protein